MKGVLEGLIFQKKVGAQNHRDQSRKANSETSCLCLHFRLPRKGKNNIVDTSLSKHRDDEPLFEASIKRF